MKVKFKKLHPDAVIPLVTPGNAGADLTAIDITYESEKDLYLEYDTGIAVEIPEGYVGLVFPRSSISKTDLTLANAVGIIDSSYRGSIKLRFKGSAELAEQQEQMFGKTIRLGITYRIGDKIGQLVIIPYPTIEYIESDELSDTQRGDGGFGSTGK